MIIGGHFLIILLANASFAFGNIKEAFRYLDLFYDSIKAKLTRFVYLMNQLVYGLADESATPETIADWRSIDAQRRKDGEEIQVQPDLVGLTAKAYLALKNNELYKAEEPII